jgi:hypothetical protein
MIGDPAVLQKQGHADLYRLDFMRDLMTLAK